ncbi:hypothetical protein ACJMK2_034741 [Sinanodonta woodiana]|uniref:HAT C-terminal dimerisation domain-containing protein n=1 Tax=Sinanodonta woodiana TaxID=1069815 RepID=A0ABD3WSJ8_SINWO
MDELQIEYEKTITAVKIPASTEVDPGGHELDLYLAEKNQLRTSPPMDPVIYWKSSEKMFQLLAAVTKCFCSILPSSVDSERSFSTAGAICSDK